MTDRLYRHPDSTDYATDPAQVVIDYMTLNDCDGTGGVTVEEWTARPKRDLLPDADAVLLRLWATLVDGGTVPEVAAAATTGNAAARELADQLLDRVATDLAVSQPERLVTAWTVTVPSPAAPEESWIWETV